MLIIMHSELLPIRWGTASSFQIFEKYQFYTSTRPVSVHSLQDTVGVIRSLWIPHNAYNKK